MIWNKLNSGRQGMVADNNLVRFVADKFDESEPASVNFLDIGPGKIGANQYHLQMLGYEVTSVDISDVAKKNIQADICHVDFPSETFDCVYDINTLCHVKQPPFEKIRNWLIEGGWFYMICPSIYCWDGVGYGKDFTRFAHEDEIFEMVSGFSYIKPLGRCIYPHRTGNEIKSWIVEARK